MHLWESFPRLTIGAKWSLLLVIDWWTNLWLVHVMHFYVRIANLLNHTWLTCATWILVICLIDIHSVIRIIFSLLLNQFEIVVAKSSLRACGSLASITFEEASIFINHWLNSCFIVIDLLLVLGDGPLRSLKYTLAIIVAKHWFNCNYAISVVYTHIVTSVNHVRVLLLAVIISKSLLTHTAIKSRVVHFRLLWLTINFRRWC